MTDRAPGIELKIESVLSDFPGNRAYPGKSLRLTRESFFSLKVATYLDTAVTTFWENTTCLAKLCYGTFLENRREI